MPSLRLHSHNHGTERLSLVLGNSRKWGICEPLRKLRAYLEAEDEIAACADGDSKNKELGKRSFKPSFPSTGKGLHR